MTAYSHLHPMDFPHLNGFRRLGTALGRQRGPRRGGGEVDLCGAKVEATTGDGASVMVGMADV